ncbi:MAG: tetratricopeptide repeat protein [Persicimonas sp.]
MNAKRPDAIRCLQGVARLRPLAVVLVALTLAVGCETLEGGGKKEETKVVVPSTSDSAPRYQGDGSLPDEHYVVRMSDGRRDWEVSFPSSNSGYQVRIPLEGDEPDAERADMLWEDPSLTSADKELIEEMRRENPDMEREGAYVDGEHVNDRQAERESDEDDDEASDDGDDRDDEERRDDEGDEERAERDEERRGDEARPAPTRPSYLKGVAHIQDLYERGKYELAMARLSQLEQAYPDDVKLLSMKGTLWVELGREDLARKAWERVLQLDPDNEHIAKALEDLE